MPRIYSSFDCLFESLRTFNYFKDQGLGLEGSVAGLREVWAGPVLNLEVRMFWFRVEGLGV